jgi:hypothetical protein
LVLPNLPGAIQDMARQKEQYRIAAGKTYTQWGPDGKGYWLDDERYGIPFIEQARARGVKVICVHKGLPLFGFDYVYSTCRDIGAMARLYPDMTLIVYHSGYEPWRTEGPYDPARPEGGVDSLIRSLQDNGIPPNRNVYAELGSTWRLLMREPDEVAHVLGKSVAEEAHEPDRVASLLGDAGYHHVRRRPDEGRVPAQVGAERERPRDRYQLRVVQELGARISRPQLLCHPDHERAHGRHVGNIVNDPGGEGEEPEQHY